MNFSRNEGVPGSIPGVGSEKPRKSLITGRAVCNKTGTCPQYVSRWAHSVGIAAVPTGHVFRVERKRGPAWYAKYRLPDGRQVQKKLGPAWTERGRPAGGNFTKRQAEARLREVLDEARRGTLPGMVRAGATFADAAAGTRGVQTS